MTKLLLLLSIFLYNSSTAGAQGKYLETIKVSDSIYVFNPKIDWVHGNGVAIIGDKGVFFIDTYQQTTYADEAIALLKKITKLPVQYVLNTHWHYDHVMGNSVFKKQFKDCRFIMGDSTYTGMIKYVTKQVEEEARTINDFEPLEKQIREEKAGSYPITPAMKYFWDWQLKEAKEYAKAYKGNQMVNGDITFNDSLSFHWGSMTIQLINLPLNAHSRGDVIAWIPEKKLVVTGDIVVGPTPYETHGQPAEMLKGLQMVIDLNPSIIIPGHGKVEYGLAYVNLLKTAFSTYLEKTLQAIADKKPVGDVYKTMRIPEIDDQFINGDEVKRWAYESFFVRNLIYYTYKNNGALPEKKK